MAFARQPHPEIFSAELVLTDFEELLATEAERSGSEEADVESRELCQELVLER